MKKLISVFLIVVMILTPIISLATDYSSYSDDELVKELDAISAEIIKRQLKIKTSLDETIPENKSEQQSNEATDTFYIFNKNGFTIRMDGKPRIGEIFEGVHGLEIDVICENIGKEDMSVLLQYLCVNGWNTTVLFGSDLKSGQKSKNCIQAYTFEEDTGIKSIDEIETIEFFGYYGSDGEYVFEDENCNPYSFSKLVLK